METCNLKLTTTKNIYKMEAKELSNQLRNGNWINYIGKPIQVTIKTIWSVSEKSGRTVIFSPIPLTEEWLLKFDFKKQKTCHMPTYSVRCKSLIWFTIRQSEEYQDYEKLHLKEPKKWWSFDGNKHDIKIEYVHQLQNLYFALTGEELILKQ